LTASHRNEVCEVGEARSFASHAAGAAWLHFLNFRHPAGEVFSLFMTPTWSSPKVSVPFAIGDDVSVYQVGRPIRSSDITAFFYLGRLIEFDRTEKLFTNPVQKQTEDYISGRFG
jgi:hypothetical protein